MPWKNVKVRADLHEMVAKRARQETRSVAQMADRLLMRALEQETGTGTAAPVGETPGEAGNGADIPSPARAPVAQRIEGQTTVDEMLASCPNCAGEMQDYCLDDGRGGGEMAKRCEDCGYVREGT